MRSHVEAFHGKKLKTKLRNTQGIHPVDHVYIDKHGHEVLNNLIQRNNEDITTGDLSEPEEEIIAEYISPKR